MTVAELIEMLKGFESDRVVVMQKDSEGNGYSPGLGAWEGWYEAESTWRGECPHPDDVESGEVELSDQAVKAVILYPVS